MATAGMRRCAVCSPRLQHQPTPVLSQPLPCQGLNPQRESARVRRRSGSVLKPMEIDRLLEDTKSGYINRQRECVEAIWSGRGKFRTCSTCLPSVSHPSQLLSIGCFKGCKSLILGDMVRNLYKFGHQSVCYRKYLKSKFTKSFFF